MFTRGRFACFACFACLALSWMLTASLGCSPAAGHGHARHAEQAASNVVSDEAFASAVRDLLASEPGSRDRSIRLAGVMGRQLARSSFRFRARSPERGLQAISGAFYLARVGDVQKDTLGPHGLDALRASARELSRKGDEGRARAMYEQILRLGTPDERTDAQTHIQAIGKWVREGSAGAGSMQAAGLAQRAAARRFLLEPSQEAKAEAVARTLEWIQRATTLRTALRDRRTAQPSREEAGEAVRALGTGGATLIAIFLRDRDAKGAVAAIESAKIREYTRPDLMNAVSAVAGGEDARAWVEVVRALGRSSGRDAHEDDEPEDGELMRAAMFFAAQELYRLDPTIPDGAGTLAAGLEDLGMGEAAPAVLVDTVRKNPEPRIVSSSLALTMRVMQMATIAEESDSARRAFQAALPLLRVADDKTLAPKLEISAARVRAMMGEIEMRDGRLPQARALFVAAMSEQKTAQVLLSLGRIDYHEGKVAPAVSRLREALAMPETQKDPTLRAEILLQLSDITREQGDKAGARTPLTEALRELASARGTPDLEDRARAERLLSRVLDRFGATEPATQALERALDVASRYKAQAAATVGQLVARAFVRADLKAAREGLARGVAFDIGPEDLVYYALWVRLLERQLRAPADGLADKIFAQSLTDPRWLGRLAAFGSGQLKPDELVAAAKTPAQRTEALFYLAMDRRAAGDRKAADATLRQVLTAGGVELVEFSLARELLTDGRQQLVPGPVPEVGLP